MRIFPNVGARVETGPIQFGEDWPGIFIRGDNAMGWISMLSAIQTDDPWAKSAIKGLTELLQSCDARTLDATAAPVCTCPSGDGSLRWPCTTHTPTAAPVVVGEDVERLRELLFCAYQAMGVHDAPEIWLDALSNAAHGEPFSTDGLLPYMPDAVCDAEMDARRFRYLITPDRPTNEPRLCIRPEGGGIGIAYGDFARELIDAAMTAALAGD